MALASGVVVQPDARRYGQLALGLLPWSIFGAAGLIYLAEHGLSGAPTPPDLLQTTTLAFFAALLVRLIITAAVSRRRRKAVLVMTIALVLWGAGSAMLNTSQSYSDITFPSVAEALFVPSYMLLAVFLLLDVRKPDLRATALWLDSVVVLGGTLCVLGLALVVPLAAVFPQSGPLLGLLLFYPMLDIVLFSLVISQVMLRSRPKSWLSVVLASGFVALLSAEVISVALSLHAQQNGSLSYASNQFSQLFYGVGFALLVEASCRPRQRAAAGAAGGRNIMIVAAAGIAVLVLLVRPAGSGAMYLTVPAVITLAAVGARLMLALRQAREAGEALRLSLTDDLTGLPNRRAILADLQRRIAGKEPLGLLLLGLDGFKEVNDSLGHNAGDAVLYEVGQRLPEYMPSSGLVGRLGGDEFAVVVRRDDGDELLSLARRAREALLQPLTVDGLEITLRASAGVTARMAADTRAADLLRRADVAMYEAKNTRAGALVYDPERDLFTRERLELAEQLRAGIATDQLVIWYQPQVDTKSMRVTGAEALVRWQHPERGLISPMEFLPIARRSGLMGALTDVVMNRVIVDAARWSRRGLKLRVSFNCAPPELLSPSLLPKLFRAIDQARLPSETLLVEVTEDSFVADPGLARERLQQLRNHCVQTAIDDYGTGFSSLAYIRDLPVQELKIDRSFVSTMLHDTRSHVIVDSTRQMAHAMGLRLVAEGVEDNETVLALAALDIDLLQGYHVSPPMPVDAFEPWLKRWTAEHHIDLRGNGETAA